MLFEEERKRQNAMRLINFLSSFQQFILFSFFVLQIRATVASIAYGRPYWGVGHRLSVPERIRPSRPARHRFLRKMVQGGRSRLRESELNCASTETIETNDDFASRHCYTWYSSWIPWWRVIMSSRTSTHSQQLRTIRRWTGWKKFTAFSLTSKWNLENDLRSGFTRIFVPFTDTRRILKHFTSYTRHSGRRWWHGGSRPSWRPQSNIKSTRYPASSICTRSSARIN